MIINILRWIATLLIAFLNCGSGSAFRLSPDSRSRAVYLYLHCRKGIWEVFRARLSAKWMKMPEAVQKYLGFTLLPHSGVSLVFTGIVCATLEGGGESEYAVIVKGTIAAAAVINEMISVILAEKGFERAGEITAAAS